jgi:aryl-alcohol dehydrogenase-like predicted oxidoreductase
LIGRDVERDFIPMLRNFGLGLTVWGPLASGFLSGKYKPGTAPAADERYASLDYLPFDRAHAFHVLERMHRIARKHNATIAQIALAWLLAKDAVTSILVGATKLEQLRDNLGAKDIYLDSADLAELDRLSPPAAVYPQWVTDPQIAAEEDFLRSL